MVAVVTRVFPVTCDERLQSSGDRLPFADWSVDEVQEVGVGVGRVQIGCFTGVNHRASAHRHEHVEGVVFSKRDGFFKTVTQRYLELIIYSVIIVHLLLIFL